MPYWQHSPEGVHQRLIELAELYAGCRAIYFELLEDEHWKPAPGSAAAADAASLPPPTILEGDQISAGFARVTEVLASYLEVASGHLGGLAALHAAEEVMFPAGMLVRAVLENCARVIWIVGSGGDEPPEAMLARAYLEERLSAEEAKKNAGRMSARSSSGYRRACEEWKRLHAEISSRFPASTPAELADYSLAGQQLARPERCVKGMYEFLADRTESSVTAEVGVGVYGYLCNVTHPTLYPVRELRDWVAGTDGHDHPTALNRLPVDFLERQASAAVVTFFNTVSYVTSYFGWPTTHHRRLAALIDGVLPGTIPE